MQTICVANQKGGVGKTTTAHNLGVLLAGAGLRVLLVDCDPQSSLTQSAGVRDVAGHSLAEVLGGAKPGRLTLPDVIVTLGEKLYLVPGDIALSGVELGLTSRLGRENVLRRTLATVAGNIDVCLIDCPPSLGLLTVCSLVAANAVLIPTPPQAADLRGLTLFLDTIEQIKELNPDLVLLGVVPTFYDGRLNHHRQMLENMRQSGLPVLPVTIGRSVRVAEAAGAGEAVTTFDPRNPRAAEYSKLAELVKQWLKK